MAIVMADLVAMLRADSVQFDASMLRADALMRQVSRSGGAAASSVTHLGMTMGLIAGGGLALAVKAAMDYQSKLVHVQSQTGMTNAEIGRMSTIIQTMASQSGASLNDLADGFMHIHNFGFSAAQVMPILQQGMESALSTGDNVAQVASVLGGVMHELHINVSDAAKAMNVMHIAAQEGNSTLGEFATGTTQAFNMAGNYKVSLLDVAAALSTLTQSNQSARMASMGISATFQGIVKPAAAARDALMALGGQKLVDEFSTTGLATRGFANILGDLKRATDGVATSPLLQSRLLHDYSLELISAHTKHSTFVKDMAMMAKAIKDPAQAMNVIFANVRAAREAMILTGNQADSFAKHLHDMGAAWSGLLDPTKSGFAAQQATFSAQLQKLQANFQILAITIGNVLLPPLTEIAARMVPVLQGVLHWTQANPQFVRTLVTVALAIAGMGAALAVVHYIIAPVIAVISALSTPLIVLGLAAAALYLAWTHDWGGIREVVKSAWDQSAPVFATIRAVLEKLAGDIRGGHWDTLWRDIGKELPIVMREVGSLLGRFGTEILNWVKTEAPRVGKQFGTWAKEFSAWVGPAVTYLLKNWPGMLDRFLNAVEKGAAPFAKAIVSWIVKGLPGFVKALVLISAALIVFLVETQAILIKHVAKWAIALVSFVKPMIPHMLGQFGNLITDLVHWFQTKAGPELLKQADNLGGNFVSGLKSGIEHAAGGLFGGIVNLFGGGGGVHKTAKKSAGAQSPSVIWRQIGQDLVAGLVQGIQGGAANAHKAAGDVLTGIAQGGSTGGSRVAHQNLLNTAMQRATTISRDFLLTLRLIAAQYDRILRPVQQYQIRQSDLLRQGQYGVTTSVHGTSIEFIAFYNPAMGTAALATGRTVDKVIQIPPAMNNTHTSVHNVSELLRTQYNPQMLDAALFTSTTSGSLLLLGAIHAHPSASLDTRPVLSAVIAMQLAINRLHGKQINESIISSANGVQVPVQFEMVPSSGNMYSMATGQTNLTPPSSYNQMLDDITPYLGVLLQNGLSVPVSFTGEGVPGQGGMTIPVRFSYEAISLPPVPVTILPNIDGAGAGKKAGEDFIDRFKRFLAELGPIFIGVLTGGITVVLGRLKDLFTALLKYIKDLIGTILGGIKDILGTVLGGVKDILGGILGGIKDILGGILGGIKDIFGGGGGGGSGGGTTITGNIDQAGVQTQLNKWHLHAALRLDPSETQVQTILNTWHLHANVTLTGTTPSVPGVKGKKNVDLTFTPIYPPLDTLSTNLKLTPIYPPLTTMSTGLKLTVNQATVQGVLNTWTLGAKLTLNPTTQPQLQAILDTYKGLHVGVVLDLTGGKGKGGKGGTGGSGGSGGFFTGGIDLPVIHLGVIIPLDAIGKAKDGLLKALAGWGGDLATAGANAGLALVKGIGALFAGISSASGSVGKGKDALLGAIGLGAGGLAAAGKQLASSIWSAVWVGLEAAGEADIAFGGLLVNIDNALVGLAQSGANVLGPAGEAFAVAVFKNFPQMVWNLLSGKVKGIASVAGEIANVFKGASGWLVSAGKDLIGGLISGIQSMGTVFEHALKTFLDQHHLGFLADYWGLHSPSRVMATMGVQLIQGLIVGMQSAMPALTTQVRSVASGVTALQTGANSPAITSAHMKSGPTVQVQVMMNGKVIHDEVMAQMYKDQRLRVNLVGGTL